MNDYTPLETAIALSLFAYNVSPGERAQRLDEHLGGDYVDLSYVSNLFSTRSVYAATELSLDVAEAYVDQALEMYGEQARERVLAERGAV